MKHMKVIILLLFLVCCLGPVMAEQPGKTAIVDYSSTPLGLDEKVDPAQLAWLNQVFRLMGSSDFTFIYRKDADHWMGLYRERLSMVIHIHDGSAGFEFRAMVDQKTGKLTVLKASGRGGKSRTSIAINAARTGKEYLSRVLENTTIFGPAGNGDHSSKSITSTESPDKNHNQGEGSATAENQGHATSAKESDPLKRLMAGNQRFASGKSEHPDQSVSRREELGKGQKPFAIILTCSDSRLPPELLFDTGLGDLFVVRTAGEVVGSLEIGSIEYAAEHLHATQLLILGHERCGAVDAAVKGGELPPNIASIVREIKPAVDQTKGKKGDALENAVKQNALNVKEKVLGSALLEELIHKKELKVNVAYYDLDTGIVSLLDD